MGPYLLSYMGQNDKVICSDVKMVMMDTVDEAIAEKMVNVSVTERTVSVRVSDSGLFLFFLVCHLEVPLLFLPPSRSLFHLLVPIFDVFGLKSPAMLDTSLVLPI